MLPGLWSSIILNIIDLNQEPLKSDREKIDKYLLTRPSWGPVLKEKITIYKWPLDETSGQMTRRFFIKQCIWSAFVLVTGCGKRHVSLWPVDRDDSICSFSHREEHLSTAQDGIEILAPEIISFSESTNRNIYVRCQFPAKLVDSLGIHPLKGAVLCAVEAKTQTPYCRNISKMTKVPETEAVRREKSGRFLFQTDLIRVLELPRKDTTYYVHVSCMQYHSPVIGLRVTK